nr:DUF1194 domain-containing protein [Thalassovita gelatinovora]
MIAPPARAADCRLALVLALDVSSSVSKAEDGLQRRGMAAALLAPEVETAFFAAPAPVALAVYEWSGRSNQKLLLDWVLISTPADLFAVAERLGRSNRSTRDFPTALGHALGYGATLLQRGPECLFRTLDISGDGENNEGFGPQQAYSAFPFAGVVVNGLVIEVPGESHDTPIVPYFRDHVLHGPGAFLQIAAGYEDYETALRRKLERELAPMITGMLEPAQ